MNNSELKDLYNKVYGEGAENFFSFDGVQEMYGIIDSAKSEWLGSSVLEIGCGEGHLAAALAMHGANVFAVDYSEEAIQIAQEKFRLPNLQFACMPFDVVDGKFDFVVMEGVLEHIDNPLHALRSMVSMLNRPGKIISTSPNFLNPRGYIWMALLKLFDVPMSLSDIHYFCPFDYEGFASELGADLTYRSTDQDWGHGKRLLVDFKKRLHNALRDKGMDADVDGFMEWLAKTIEYPAYTEFSGANIAYTLSFNC